MGSGCVEVSGGFVEEQDVGAGEQRPVVKDGALTIATVMTCTLSVDHRVVDGALAAEWIAAFKRVVEDPLSLML